MLGCRVLRLSVHLLGLNWIATVECVTNVHGQKPGTNHQEGKDYGTFALPHPPRRRNHDHEISTDLIASWNGRRHALFVRQDFYLSCSIFPPPTPALFPWGRKQMLDGAPGTEDISQIDKEPCFCGVATLSELFGTGWLVQITTK